MARFDVYANPDGTERRRIPFYLDVQNDHVLGLQTRIVVPLWKSGLRARRAEELHPEFTVAGQLVVMDTPALGAAPADLLRSAVANLAAQKLAIQDALDMLFGSY